MTERGRNAAALAAVSLLAAFLLVLGLRFAAANPLPQGRDECAHLKSAVLFQRILEDDPLAFLALLGGRMEGGYHPIVYPPLQPAVTALAKTLIPYEDDYRASVATNYLWWLAALVALYLAGSRIGGTAAGVFSAGVFALYPIVFFQMPVYSPYSLAAAPVAVCFWLLLRTESFTRPGATLLFALGLAAALLTYYTAALFLAGPILVYLVAGLRSEPERRGRVATLAFAALAFAALAALPYYTNENFQGYLGKIVTHFVGNVRATPGDFGLGDPSEHGLAAHLFYYAIVLWTQQVGPLLLGAFAAATGLLVWKTKGHRAALLVGAALPIVLLSFVGSKLVERTVPALPFFALVTGAGLARLPRRWIAWTVFAAVAVLAALPLARGYAETMRRNAIETEAGRTYRPQVELFARIAEKGGEIDIGCATYHTFYEYMRALAGIRGEIWSAVHHAPFYERFDDLEIVTYLSPPRSKGPRPEWFTADYLREKAAMRAYLLSSPLPTQSAEAIAAAKSRFVKLACDVILRRNYCVWARADWWTGGVSRSAEP